MLSDSSYTLIQVVCNQYSHKKLRKGAEKCDKEMKKDHF